MNEHISLWVKQTGVLPVNLLHCQNAGVLKYAMLDGDINNFCLDYSENQDMDADAYKQQAWSSNMRNYIRVAGDDVMLYRVGNVSPERISKSLVLNNMEKFYQYISPKQDVPNIEGIVPFVMKEFRGIRNWLREENSAESSMTALLYMLAFIKDNGNIGNDSLVSLGLPANTLDIVGKLTTMEEHLQHLRAGMNGFLPNISLLLRHAAGQLFEEANYIAKFNPQWSLFTNYDIKYAYDPQKLGAFYTPTYLARSIVEKVIKESHIEDKEEISILDPACGSGEFLVEALRQLKTIGFTGKVKVYGWDVSSIAINIANFVLHFEKEEWNNSLELHIEEHDSIVCNWPNVDIVFMNPPYSSWEQLNDEQRESVKELMPKGKPNLSGVFYLKAVNALKESGVIGCVMPTSFLINDSTKELRKISKEKATPFYIGRLGSFVFQRAFVDVCVVMAKVRADFDGSITMLWTDNKGKLVPDALRKLRMIDYGAAIPLNMEDVSIYQQDAKSVFNNEVWMPLSYKEMQVKKTLDGLLACGAMERVKDVFNVRQGCRTGNNSLFKIKKQELLAMGEEEQSFFRPSVDSGSLQNNVLQEESYVFFPYGENGLNILSEEQLENKVPTYYRKIVGSKESLASRASGIREWWALTRPGSWQYTPELKLVSAEFGNSSNYSIDESGRFVVERGLAWLPKDEQMPIDNLYAYLAILSSEYYNTLLAIYSKQLAGGIWFNLEKKFVDQIPLPRFSDNEDYTLQLLIGYGKKIANGVRFDYYKCEHLVRGLYGC